MDAEEHLVSAPEEQQPQQQVYTAEFRRWYIMAAFCTLTCTQCLVWFTFSSVDEDITKEYYGIGRASHDLLLNWGPIIFLPVTPFASWLLTQPEGLRRTMLYGSILTFTGCAVRMIPCLFSTEGRKEWYSIALLHLGQIFNAAAGPMVMGPVSRISVIWLKQNERTTGTAIAQTANGMGSCVGFLLGPFIVPNVAHADQMSTLLLVELAMAAVPLTCVLIHFPDLPVNPPNAAAAIYREGGTTDTAGFVSGLREVGPNRSFWLVVLCAGLMFGVQSAWSPLFQDILDPVGISDDTVGWLGFAEGFASIVVAVLVGQLADRLFARKFKLFILISIYICAAAVWWFTLMLPSPFSSDGVLPRSTALLAVALLIQGIFQGALVPLLYEFSAELTYPVNEGTSAGILTFIWNAATLVVLAVSSKIATDVPSMLYAIALVLCAGLVTFTKENYKRSDAEAVHVGQQKIDSTC